MGWGGFGKVWGIVIIIVHTGTTTHTRLNFVHTIIRYFAVGSQCTPSSDQSGYV